MYAIWMNEWVNLAKGQRQTQAGKRSAEGAPPQREGLKAWSISSECSHSHAQPRTVITHIHIIQE